MVRSVQNSQLTTGTCASTSFVGHEFRSTMKPVVILWGIVCLISFSKTENESDIKVFQGNVLVYEMNFFIPKCGTVSEALYKIIQLLNNVSICEVIDHIVSRMGFEWGESYIGCTEPSQFARSGLFYIHFFVKRIDTNVDASCLNSSAKKFDQFIREIMEIHGTIDSEAFEIKKAVIQRDAIIIRQGFEYSRWEWLEIQRLSEESRISRKYQTRIGLELCLKRKQRELMNDSRLYTYWWAGLTDIRYLSIRNTLEIECPSSDSHDNEVQSTNKTLTNTGQEVTIPCSGDYESTTTISIYSTEVTQPSASILDITTMVSRGRIHRLSLNPSTQQFRIQYL
ncbi:unnamed protein product [Fasciola hepatica]|uniref:Uncharacterized protein n=1 Tax=Fasciola hepatica TaxID=6192 RepID=A0ABC9HIG5_FASHE